MDKNESIRIHLDWWENCRTCAFWIGERTQNVLLGKCENNKSDLFDQETSTCGCCNKWDSFDLDVAFELLEKWEREEKAKANI